MKFWFLLAFIFCSNIYASDYHRLAISDPVTNDQIEVYGSQKYSVEINSKVFLLQNNESVKKINQLDYLVVFANKLSASAYTLPAEHEVSKKIIKSFHFKLNSPVIIIEESSDIEVLTHEIQHAKDFENYIDKKINSNFANLMNDHKVRLKDRIILSIIEWRGYSAQCSSIMNISDAKIGQIRNTFKLNSYDTYLKSLSNYFSNQSLDQRQAYCAFLESLKIDNVCIQIVSFASFCNQLY